MIMRSIRLMVHDLRGSFALMISGGASNILPLDHCGYYGCCNRFRWFIIGS